MPSVSKERAHAASQTENGVEEPPRQARRSHPPKRLPSRLYISGIGESVTAAELSARIGHYGKLTSELILNAKTVPVNGTQFGHCSIDIDSAGWDKLRRLSGTVFKGGKLRIEEAQPDYTIRLARDRTRPEKAPSTGIPGVGLRRKRKKDEMLGHGVIGAVHSRRANRDQLFKDGDIRAKDRRRGWIKSKYGRAIAVMNDGHGNRIKPPSDSLQKLWGVAHPQPDRLTARYDDEEGEWLDRRGRIIEEPELPAKSSYTTASSGSRVVEIDGERVEVWADDEDGAAGGENYLGRMGDQKVENITAEQVDEQLANEKKTGLSLLDAMFGDEESEDEQPAPQAATESIAKPLAREAGADARKPGFTLMSHYDPTTDVRDTNMEDEEAQDEEVEDEEDHTPSFLRAQTDGGPRQDLTAIFRPDLSGDGSGIKQTFTFFGPSADDDLDSDTNKHLNAAISTTKPAQPILSSTTSTAPALPVIFPHETGYFADALSALASGSHGLRVRPPTTPAAGDGDDINADHDTLFVTGSTDLTTPNSDAQRARWQLRRHTSTREWKRKRRDGLRRLRKRALMTTGARS
ncbi:hypothetical protein PYCC9005_000476 [Savitreella phatthalungensis]